MLSFYVSMQNFSEAIARTTSPYFPEMEIFD